MKKFNLESAKELLISLFKREIDNSEYYQTQTKFDIYVQEFCNNSNIEEDILTLEQLNECASNFIEYDGGDYLLQDEKEVIENAIPGNENSLVMQDEENFYINLNTGIGESIYPKSDFSLEEAIQESINWKIE